MPHQTQLEKKKYRNWVQAGLGLKYVKEGLQPFCEDIVQQQHDDIISNIKQNKNLSTVTCGQCNLRTLMPDHVKVGNKQCPLGQVNCNCWYPAGKIPCPNNVCGAIYDQIIKAHGSTPPAPYWENTDIQKWSTDPWSVAKCFINAHGYDRKASATETDCTGLLHLIINNTEFHNHIQCQITGTDVFSKIKDYRNTIFHSSTMELDDADMKFFIADMKAVLQDGMELKHRHDSQTAVFHLQELEKEDFIITTKCEAEVFSASVEAIKARQRELEERLKDNEKETKETIDNLPSKDDVGNLEQRVTTLESDMSEQKEQIRKLNEDQLKFREELEKLKTLQSSHKEQNDYVHTKLDFQSELIEFYKDQLLKVSFLPLNPRKNVTEFTNVYIKPQMVTERNDTQSKQPEEMEIPSMHELFVKDGRPHKSIYVVGEAGSGKTTFCKSLANLWCLAHTDQQINEDVLEGIEEMRRFEFLFYISLSHFSDKSSIREMLLKKYGHPVLEEILDKDSRTSIIILDGLDEWSPQQIESPPDETTKGLPIREHFKNYTVITTSRPWKLETLQITENEIHLKVKLKEFDEPAVKNMIERTVNILNESFRGDKNAEECEKHIMEMPVSEVKHTPIILQQLICLWFEGKLHGTSRCAIYSAMLELFFEWNTRVSQNDLCFVEMRKLSTCLIEVQLPQPLNIIEACRTYKYLIESMAHLAYETLFNNKKETSVSFDSSSFERCDFSEDTKKCCLKLGILSEDKEESMALSRRQSSIYAFVHKSQQEFLAAVYIALHARAMLENTDIHDRCIRFICKYFKCITVDDILDKENVFIMVCGLDPRLGTFISEYVYNIVSDDKHILHYRASAPGDSIVWFDSFPDYMKGQARASDIQYFIYNCMDEVLAWNSYCEARFYLGDVIVNTVNDLKCFLLYCDKMLLLPKNILSFSLEIKMAVHPENTYSAFKYLLDCSRLVAVKINVWQSFLNSINTETEQCINSILDRNISTLKAVSVLHSRTLVFETLMCRLPSMYSLVALAIGRFTVSHEQCTSLVLFLSHTEQLQYISINIKCDCMGKHNLDLSKNRNLQFLRFSEPFCLTSINNSSLEYFSHINRSELIFPKLTSADNSNEELLRDVYAEDVCSGTIPTILNTCNRLTYLELSYDLCFCNDHETITRKFIALLSSLHTLCDLILHSFTFTDNIISCPSEMKDLRRINLFHVTMGTTTWRRFVDSLIVIPSSVKVNAYGVCITKDGEECNPDNNALLKGGGEEAAAFQYVRERETFFSMKMDIAERNIAVVTQK